MVLRRRLRGQTVRCAGERSLMQRAVHVVLLRSKASLVIEWRRSKRRVWLRVWIVLRGWLLVQHCVRRLAHGVRRLLAAVMTRRRCRRMRACWLAKALRYPTWSVLRWSWRLLLHGRIAVAWRSASRRDRRVWTSVAAVLLACRRLRRALRRLLLAREWVRRTIVSLSRSP